MHSPSSKNIPVLSFTVADNNDVGLLCLVDNNVGCGAVVQASLGVLIINSKMQLGTTNPFITIIIIVVIAL
jgi:hypothetical protein